MKEEKTNWKNIGILVFFKIGAKEKGVKNDCWVMTL